MKIEDFDWRMHGVTTITKDIPAAGPGAPFHPAGTPIWPSSSVEWDSRRFGFGRPSTLKIAYDIALTASIESILAREQVQLVPHGNGVTVQPASFSYLYNYFEKYMITIVFSLLTLEILCNFTIGKKLPTNTVLLHLEKKPRHYTAEELQKPNISLLKKMTTVLPTILKKPSIEDSNPQLWGEVKNLINLRNKITHLTPFDVFPEPQIGTPNLDKESVFAEIVNSNPSNAPRYILEVVDYYKNDVLSEKWVEQMREQYVTRYSHQLEIHDKKIRCE
jgi:hypothetical protein